MDAALNENPPTEDPRVAYESAEGEEPEEVAEQEPVPLTVEGVALELLATVCNAVEAESSATEAAADELLTVACTPGLSHSVFRLYVVLAAVSRKRGAQGKFFPITLTGLQKIHPGTSGKVAGFTTMMKQVAELRSLGLLDMRATLHRNEPDLPVLMKVLPPAAGETWCALEGSQLGWTTTDGSRLTASDVGRVSEL